jgi:hypothetical protein
MKLNLAKLQQVALQYTNQSSINGMPTIDNSLTQFALETMIRVTLEYNESSYGHAPTNVKLAFETLKDLGIIVLDEIIQTKPQQLNS